MLTFCEKCGNIMVLEDRSGEQGHYRCRKCGFTQKMKVNNIKLSEKVREEPVPNVTSEMIGIKPRF